MKRVKLVLNRPNLLFETWLIEWRKEALSKNPLLYYDLEKALYSLRKYPLPLSSGRQCMVLEHFGEKLCAMLDKKLSEHRKQNEHKAIHENVVSSKEDDELRPVKRVEIAEAHRQGKKIRGMKAKANQINSVTALVNPIRTEPSNSCNQIDFEPGTYDIILLVDTQETSRRKAQTHHDTATELLQLNVPFEIRRLKIGDFLWIARCRKTGKELVLPYIIERKRMDDLAGSLVDGRFHEQKFRLRRSCIKNPIYLVEDISTGHRLSLPRETLLQTAVNTLVHDGFIVEWTKNHKDSMSYLSNYTETLITLYKNKRLIGCQKEEILKENFQLDLYNNKAIRLMEFNEFNKGSSKQRMFRVNEMFVRQLLQLKGMSVGKAGAIVNRYPTPQILIKALKTSLRGEEILANIEIDNTKRRIGSAIAKTIYEFYMFENLK